MKKPQPGRPLPSDPRFELTFEPSPAPHLPPASLIAGLKALRERGGAAVGSAYALAARSILSRLERLEDSNAERRFRQRAERATSAARKPAQAATVQPSPPPAK